MRETRNMCSVSRAAEEPNILTGTAGIAFHPRKLRAEARTIAGIDELYCHMPVFAKAKERAFGTDQ